MPSTEIALVGEGGQLIGSKPRHAVTINDTCHSVFILVVTPEKQLLLRKLPSGKLSATAMTIRLLDEDPLETVKRGFPDAIHFHHLGDQLLSLPGQKTYVSVYYAVAEHAENPNIIAHNKDEIDAQVLTPAFTILWQQYKHLLPL